MLAGMLLGLDEDLNRIVLAVTMIIIGLYYDFNMILDRMWTRM